MKKIWYIPEGGYSIKAFSSYHMVYTWKHYLGFPEVRDSAFMFWVYRNVVDISGAVPCWNVNVDDHHFPYGIFMRYMKQTGTVKRVLFPRGHRVPSMTLDLTRATREAEDVMWTRNFFRGRAWGIEGAREKPLYYDWSRFQGKIYKFRPVKPGQRRRECITANDTTSSSSHDVLLMLYTHSN